MIHISSRSSRRLSHPRCVFPGNLHTLSQSLGARGATPSAFRLNLLCTFRMTEAVFARLPCGKRMGRPESRLFGRFFVVDQAMGGCAPLFFWSYRCLVKGLGSGWGGVWPVPGRFLGLRAPSGWAALCAVWRVLWPLPWWGTWGADDGAESLVGWT